MPDAEKAEARKRWKTPLAVATTYFAEGFPYAIVNNLPEIVFKELGFGLEMIGLTSLLHQPWNFKFLWAPFCERLARKKLLIACEIALGSALFLPAVAAIFAKNSTALFGLFALMAIMSATCDIAIDGYYLEALDEKDQSRFVGLRQIAYRLANLLVRGPLLALLAAFGLGFTFSAMGALLVALGILHLVLLDDVKVESGRTNSSWLSSLGTILSLPRIGLLLPFAISFRAGESLLQKMRYAFMSGHFGIGLGEWSAFNGMFGVVASILGTTLGGVLLAKHGLRRWFWPFIAAQNVLNLLYSGLALGVFGSSRGAAYSVLLADEFGSGLGTSALLVFLMHLCRGAHKTAHFAFWTAVMSLVFTYGGALSGFLAKAVGFPSFFALTFVASFPMMILAIFLPETRRGPLGSEVSSS